jgi:hypothetical protein
LDIAASDLADMTRAARRPPRKAARRWRAARCRDASAEPRRLRAQKEEALAAITDGLAALDRQERGAH